MYLFLKIFYSPFFYVVGCVYFVLFFRAFFRGVARTTRVLEKELELYCAVWDGHKDPSSVRHAWSA